MKKPINPTSFISLYLDTRHANVKGTYPVKLRVYSKLPRKQKLYQTTFRLSEKDFLSAWDTMKPRKEYKDLRSELQAVLTKAEEAAKGLSSFTFPAFEKLLLSKKDERQEAFCQYRLIIQKLRDNKQFGTADNYEMACKSLIDYVVHLTGRKAEALLFSEITSDWLKGYESYMSETKGRSLTTVSMYLRTLRTLFNAAIDAGDIGKELYPFGRRKYVVPGGRNIKKALSKAALKTLLNATPMNFEEERAKDFFFFSYACNGMNMKDIAELKYENIKGDTLQFVRAKTQQTGKANSRPVIVPLVDYSKGIIEKYGTKDKKPGDYIFPILSPEAGAYMNYRKVKNLIVSVNHNIKKLAKAAGIKENISTYAARHSFATVAIREGASMEHISEALNHSDMKTTKNYFAGFEDGTRRVITENLMKF